MYCIPHTVCGTGDIRLVGGTNEFEGRVEVCVNNQWGTICDRNWEAAEAAVACRQAGFSSTGWFVTLVILFGMCDPNTIVVISIAGSVFLNSAFFGQGTGPIVLDNVLCFGTEPRIYDCANSNGVINRVCSHARDASVRCLPSNTS